VIDDRVDAGAGRMTLDEGEECEQIVDGGLRLIGGRVALPCLLMVVVVVLSWKAFIVVMIYK